MSELQPFFHDGNLRVRIPCGKVRWIDFLTYSRLLNSREGGWDFKSTRKGGGLQRWKADGLERLVEADFIEFVEQWTGNSLKNPKAYPRPRPNDFRLGRDFTNDRKRAAASCDPNKIGTCSENSLNARLFQNHGVFPSGETMTCGTNPFSGPLLGYEVPLCDDSDGQLKIDLLACDQITRQLEIIELKQASNANNSPLMALIEGICYGLQLWRCRVEFSKESRDTAKRLEDSRFELKLDDFKTLQLTIAAPRDYWKSWGCTDNEAKTVMGQMEQILAAVNRQTKKLRGPELKLSTFCIIDEGQLPR